MPPVGLALLFTLFIESSVSEPLNLSCAQALKFRWELKSQLFPCQNDEIFKYKRNLKLIATMVDGVLVVETPRMEVV